jgi:hypothetical protein
MRVEIGTGVSRFECGSKEEEQDEGEEWTTFFFLYKLKVPSNTTF